MGVREEKDIIQKGEGRHKNGKRRECLQSVTASFAFNGKLKSPLELHDRQ